MVWRVQQENNELQTSELLPGQEQSEQKSFDRAEEAYWRWKRATWGWNGNSPQAPEIDGGDDNGPAPGGKYKVYYDTDTPGAYLITVRYDYLKPNGEPFTNEVVFRVVDI